MAECIACRASRRTTVDAFFEGYLAGAVEMATVNDLIAPEHALSFCLAHERMATEAMAALSRQLDDMATERRGEDPR